MNKADIVSIYEEVEALANVVEVLVHNLTHIEERLLDIMEAEGIIEPIDEDDDEDDDDDDEPELSPKPTPKPRKKSNKITDYDMELFKKFLDVLPSSPKDWSIEDK